MAGGKPFTLPSFASSKKQTNTPTNTSIEQRSAQINSGIIEKIHIINPDTIVPNPFQPRKYFSESALKDLANDIKRDGQLQPIIVLDTGSRYILVVGERRVRACKILGIKVKAIIEKSSEDKLLVDSTRLLRVAMMENIKREDLTTIERAESLFQLSKTQEYSELSKIDFSEKIGISYTTLNRLYDILKLSPYIKEQLRLGSSVSLQALENLSRLDYETANFIYNKIITEDLKSEESLDLIRKSKIDKRGDNTKKPSSLQSTLEKFNWGTFKSTSKKIVLDISLEKASSEMINEIKEMITKYESQNN